MVERAPGRYSIEHGIDRSMVDRARYGDLDAFEEIVRARIQAVYRVTLAIVGNEADASDATRLSTYVVVDGTKAVYEMTADGDAVPVGGSPAGPRA
jgi:hypothetical protein